MDEERKIRFLVAPLLFVSSLGWGMWLDPLWRQAITSSPFLTAEKGIGQAITILAGGGIFVFSLGVLIGTISYVTLRLFSLIIRWCFYHRNGVNTHEAAVSDETLRLLWAKLGAPGEFDRKRDFLAVVAFDHGLLRKSNEGVHRWMVRRWNAFSISATSITALALAVLVSYFSDIHPSRYWWSSIGFFLLVFSFTAVWSWRDTMRMLAFQATLPIPLPEKKSER